MEKSEKVPKHDKDKTSLWKNYLEWVSLHPNVALEMETAFKWISYLVTGYFRNSGSQRSSLILSEIVFALGDVLSYINNRAFEQVGEYVEKDYSHATPGISSKNALAGRNSTTAFNPDKILGGLESVELLVESLAEMYSLKSGSDTLKWVVVSAIQFLKASLRIISVQQKGQIICFPAVPKLDKNMLLASALPPRSLNEKEKQPQFSVMKRTGRYMRTLYGSQVKRNNNRVWHNIPIASTEHDARFSNLNTLRLIGEIGYIIQPLVHLASLATFGKRSWKPWIISLGFDVISSATHGMRLSKLHGCERQELSRRRFSLLMYLLRSPFYDKFTKWVIILLLTYAQHLNLPLAGTIFDTFMSYVPHYRKLYHYVWSK